MVSPAAGQNGRKLDAISIENRIYVLYNKDTTAYTKKEVIAVSFFETEKEWVNEELNNERQTVIPAIASFSTGGVVLPIYVRLGDLKLKIDKVKWHKPVSVFGERYYCLVSSCGVEFEIVLTYHTKEQVWTIDNKQIDIRKLTF